MCFSTKTNLELLAIANNSADKALSGWGLKFFSLFFSGPLSKVLLRKEMVLLAKRFLLSKYLASVSPLGPSGFVAPSSIYTSGGELCIPAKQPALLDFVPPMQEKCTGPFRFTCISYFCLTHWIVGVLSSQCLLLVWYTFCCFLCIISGQCSLGLWHEIGIILSFNKTNFFLSFVNFCGLESVNIWPVTIFLKACQYVIYTWRITYEI